MKKIVALLILAGLALNSQAQEKNQELLKIPEATEDWSRKPEVITPGNGTQPPSDAIVLYAGASDLDKWENLKGESAEWDAGEELIMVPQTGPIKTKQAFGDVQLHIEWKSPAEVKGDGQGRGNSGVFLMGLYEVQVLDSYDNLTYYNGQAGSIYKQTIPLVNACRPPGEWQTYDIMFTAPVFKKDGSKACSGFVTVIHNGVLIQNHVEILGTTEYIGRPKNESHPAKLPLQLQDHGNPVSYRNIWIREL